MKIFTKSLILGAVALLAIGCKPPGPTESYTMMTILGTYNLDIESKNQKSTPKSDLWLEHVDKNSFYLVPKNGMKMAIAKTNRLSNITKESIARETLEDKKIGNDKLTVNTIIVFKTGEGHYGKLQVQGYRPLHSFNFPEAQTYLDEDWKRFALSHDNVKKYNMVVAYKFYE
jgi:hypothetical protein